MPKKSKDRSEALEQARKALMEARDQAVEEKVREIMSRQPDSDFQRKLDYVHQELRRKDRDPEDVRLLEKRRQELIREAERGS